MEIPKRYYIETLNGKIIFESNDITKIKIFNRKQKDYVNFKPANNHKFL